MLRRGPRIRPCSGYRGGCRWPPHALSGSLTCPVLGLRPHPPEQSCQLSSRVREAGQRASCLEEQRRAAQGAGAESGARVSQVQSSFCHLSGREWRESLKFSGLHCLICEDGRWGLRTETPT